ncbi:MAG: hypothetical protein WD532_07970 [Acidimicrobiia bacterium]
MSELLPVEMRDVPVTLWHDTRRWFEELVREFAVVATSSPDAQVPRRLLEFVDEVRGRFSRFSESANIELEEAYAEGRQRASVNLHLPAEAGPIARELYDLILRADEVCREGHLLTMALSEPMNRFLEWYLSEVDRQLQGAEPTPWQLSDS